MSKKVTCSMANETIPVLRRKVCWRQESNFIETEGLGLGSKGLRIE